jgi:hypothetical protein
MMVLRWLSREETNPDPKSSIQYPREIRRKREPASSCPNFRSCSTVGIRGDKTILARKLRRKVPTRKRSGPAWGRKEVESLS